MYSSPGYRVVSGWLWAGLLLLAGSAVCQTVPRAEKELATARERMVQEQIVAREITDQRVLTALRNVQRHLFVPVDLWDRAYDDHPLPIGEDQTISQPYIVALMTELLALTGHEKVLEIGTGSGYQAAVLSLLCDSVYSVEIIPALADSARQRLKTLGYANVRVICGDGYVGLEDHAPFDGIIVTCAPSAVPQPLIAQLGEGGRLVIPVGDADQELKVLTKKQGTVSERSVIPVRFVPMTGKHVEGKK